MNLAATHLNPRGQAVKTTEMTVRRALAIIRVFDSKPPDGKDWTDCEPKDIRNALGDEVFNPNQAVLTELWARYVDGRLHQQTKDLAANLDLSKLSKKARKEIEDGINRLG